MLALPPSVFLSFLPLLFFLPFLAARFSPDPGPVALMPRPPDPATATFSPSPHLLLFAVIQMNTSASRHKDCVLDIFVEIGENTWRQPLNSNSFSFQVPIRSFGGMIGMISIHEHRGRWQRLWNHFFVVEDTGVQRIDAKLYGDCTRIINPGTDLIPWIPDMCPLPSVMIKANSLLLFTGLPIDVLRMCSVPSNHVEKICSISGALEIYPTTTYVKRKSHFRILAILETLMIYINDQLWNSGERSDWHRVFGVYMLHTWHFYCLGIVFLYLHTVNWFLRILQSITGIFSLNLSSPVTATESPQVLLDREPQTSSPISNSSFSALSWQTSIHSERHNSLPLSGNISYQDSWEDAHQYLRKLMDSPVDCSGYYYNCTAQSRAFSDMLLQSGRWSRDNNGRLIRDRPF